MSSDEGRAELGSRTARGMAWAYGSYVGGRLLTLAATAILARLLVPDEFGLVALALTMMALLEGFADLGLTQALIVEDDDRFEDRSDTVFTSTVILGAILTVLLAALGPPAARFFDEPDLAPIAAVLGSTFLLRAFGATHYALAQRSLDFRTRTIAETADVVIRGIVSIVLAVAGFGVWSLVVGYVVGTLTRDVALWILVRWRPRIRLVRSHLREMIGFGGAISGVNVVATVINNLDYVFVGKVLGTSALGFYTLGFRLPELLILNFSVVAGVVLFPAFSAVNRVDLAQAFLISFRYTVMLGMLLAVCLAGLAESVVLALFGDQWLGSVEAMQVLTVYALAANLGIPAGTILKATKRAGTLLLVALLRLALVVIGLVVFIDSGIVAVAAVQAVVTTLGDLIVTVIAVQLLSLGMGSLWREAWPSLAAAAVTTPVVIGVEHLIEDPWLTLVVGGALALVAYLATLAILAPEWLRYVRTRLRGRGAVEAPPEPDPLTGDIDNPL